MHRMTGPPTPSQMAELPLQEGPEVGTEAGVEEVMVAVAEARARGNTVTAREVKRCFVLKAKGPKSLAAIEEAYGVLS